MIYKFTPILKPTPWGGRRIAAIKGADGSIQPIGESWELSAVKGMESVVAEGPESGLTLNQLIERHGVALLGERAVSKYGHQFPLLVKFLDSSDWLSLQVHPDNRIASLLEGPDMLGKTEMWHVIDCGAGAQLIAGFKEGTTLSDYLSAEGSKDLLDIVAYHKVAPGRDFYIKAGTVHALGPGCFVAEVQTTCDFTYRVYDYGRPRPLNLDKARKSLKFNEWNIHQPVDCFSVNHHHTSGPQTIEPAEGSFIIVMVTKGVCTIDGIEATAGSTLLITADHGEAHAVPVSDSIDYLTVAV